MKKNITTDIQSPSPYLSPCELSIRWRCGRSSVDRIALREGMHKLILGSGKNGMVRYLLKEVIELETKKIF